MLALTYIHSLFVALSPNGHLDSLMVLTGHLLAVPCLVLVVDTLEGDSTTSLYAFSVNPAFFYTFGNNSEALGKGLILETPQGNITVFECFTRSRSYEVG